MESLGNCPNTKLQASNNASHLKQINLRKIYGHTLTELGVRTDSLRNGITAAGFKVSKLKKIAMGMKWKPV